MLRIGVSACFFHADPKRAIFKGKDLLYLVEDVGDWLLEQGVVPFLVPRLPESSPLSLADLVRDLDGLILQGGADVAPEMYGETPLKPEWSGDIIRDRYEIELVREFTAQAKPVFGICRGLQLLNVAYGGTLYQDIASQVDPALEHRDWEIYDQNFHEVDFVPGSGIARLYGGITKGRVNSVHHQAIKVLGSGLRAEAHSDHDLIVEAIRLEGDDYVVGVQWHPEFQDPNDPSLLSTGPLLDEFIHEARRRKRT